MSTNWITLQASDLNDYLVGAQAAALRNTALASGQVDPFDTIMRDVVDRVRNEIRGCARNNVSLTPYTIPPDLKSTAMALIVERMQQRIPQLKLTDDQKSAADNARDYLKRIARCEVPITAATDVLVPDDVQRGAPIAVVRSRPRKYTGHGLGGL